MIKHVNSTGSMGPAPGGAPRERRQVRSRSPAEGQASGVHRGVQTGHSGAGRRAAQPGQIGALLRQEGLYSSPI
jgi:hypothetical protein